MIVFTIILPILIILAIVTIWLVVRSMANMRLKKNFHRKLVIGYIALLFIVLIAAEIMVQNHDQEPPPKAPENAVQFDLRYAIDQGASVPERLVAARRTHEVEGTFTIPDFYRGAYILIERTAGESNKIEETVYKPELFAGNDVSNETLYDLSDQLQIELPVWDSHSMYVPKQPQNQINYTIYHDSNVLNQFTDQKRHVSGMVSGSMHGVMTIHLVIPESIELDIKQTGDGYDQYIELL
ncbi:hypothetical protein [Sporosarcina obsidiansis]|uniref:hypothetical protein n=1 Tax=Sporosarcina obsidiansis TaxID=2660748 RepID=UPI00129AA451|nr:hypothetical protein [Sporosarcina obsidiansis]